MKRLSKCIFYAILLIMGPQLHADYYDVINKGLKKIDPNFAKKYSYPLKEKSSQESVNAACNKQEAYIRQELKKAKPGTQKQNLSRDKDEINAACKVLTNSIKRAEYNKELAGEDKKKKDSEKKEKPEKLGERPNEDDPNYMDNMKEFLSGEFAKGGVTVLFKMLGDFLTKIDIPSAALKVFNTDVTLKDMEFINAPKGRKIRAGLGFTGTTQFNKLPVKATVFIVQDLSKKIQYSIAIELPDGYKMSQLFPNFKKVDVLSLPKSQFVASTFKYKHGYWIDKGFNFIADLALEGPLRAIGALRKKAKDFDAVSFDFEDPIYLHAVISSTTSGAFRAVVPMRLGIDFTQVKNFPKQFSTIIKKITTDDIKIGVRISPMEQKLFTQVGVQITLGHQETPFRVQAFGGIDVTSGKINFGAKMPDMLELKFIAIGDTYLEFYLDPAVGTILSFFGIPVSGLGLGGQIDLGKKKEKRVSLEAKGKFSLETKKFADVVFDVEGKNIQFAEILSLLTKMAAKSGIKGAEVPASEFPIMTINKVYGKIVPWDTEVALKKVAAGFQLELDMQLFDTRFGFDVKIKHKALAFEGKGFLPVIRYKKDKNTIFKLSGSGPDKEYGTLDDGPTVSCEFNVKNPAKNSFALATTLDIPPIGLQAKVDFKFSRTVFKADFETRFLGFAAIFGVTLDPKKMADMYIRFGFKGDFAKFLSQHAQPAIEDLKKEAAERLAAVDKTIGELAGELEELRQKQKKLEQGGEVVTQNEIERTQNKIKRIQNKIERLKKECRTAKWYRKVDVCAKVGTELTAQGAALVAQETYLKVLLKPGRKVMAGGIEMINAVNKGIQGISSAISQAEIFKKSAQGTLTALSGIVKGTEIFKVSDAVGEVNAKDLSEGKLPRLISLKVELNIPNVPKVKVNLRDVQFDFKNPAKSATKIAKKLVKGVKIK